VSEGTVTDIVIGPAEGGPVRSVTEVSALSGRGLEGDRYLVAEGEEHDPADEITLIAVEGIERASEEAGLELSPADMRRNIVTRGVDLSYLIGKRFRVGEVEIEALADNPPCRYLQELAGKPLLKPMIKHGGVRGRILRTGIIRVGDPIRML
jgi:MOSC domain-containing protein YiiM